jgi:hypothetical protein
MNCPFCPAVDRFAHRVPPRASAWLPIVLIVVVLAAATLASALTPEARDFTVRQPAPSHGRVL